MGMKHVSNEFEPVRPVRSKLRPSCWRRDCPLVYRANPISISFGSNAPFNGGSFRGSIVILTSDAWPGDTTLRVKAGLSGYAIKPLARAHPLKMVCDAIEGLEEPELFPAPNVDGEE